MREPDCVCGAHVCYGSGIKTSYVAKSAFMEVITTFCSQQQYFCSLCYFSPSGSFVISLGWNFVSIINLRLFHFVFDSIFPFYAVAAVPSFRKSGEICFVAFATLFRLCYVLKRIFGTEILRSMLLLKMIRRHKPMMVDCDRCLKNSSRIYLSDFCSLCFIKSYFFHLSIS